jgi:hypothetical protein
MYGPPRVRAAFSFLELRLDPYEVRKDSHYDLGAKDNDEANNAPKHVLAARTPLLLVPCSCHELNEAKGEEREGGERDDRDNRVDDLLLHVVEEGVEAVHVAFILTEQRPLR